jgi:hypothetical protein
MNYTDELKDKRSNYCIRSFSAETTWKRFHVELEGMKDITQKLQPQNIP